MPPHRQFKALHRPPEATPRQPNTASKCHIAHERCPKATNREAAKSCHRLRHPTIRDWVAIAGIATFIVAIKKNPKQNTRLGFLWTRRQGLGGWGVPPDPVLFKVIDHAPIGFNSRSRAPDLIIGFETNRRICVGYWVAGFSFYQTRMLHVRTCWPLSHIPPCLPSRAERPPPGPDWLHEIKHDGFRIVARRDNSGVRLYTRNGYDFAGRFPQIVEAVAKLENEIRTLLCDRTAKCALRQALGTARRCFCAMLRNIEGRLHVARKERRHDEWDPRCRPTTHTGRTRWMPLSMTDVTRSRVTSA